MTNADQQPLNLGSRLGATNDSVKPLQDEVQALREEIAQLQAVKSELLQQQLKSLEAACEKLIQNNLKQLEDRQKSLQVSVDQLERRQERVQAEMKKNFAGVSQDIAIRVQGFKDYLVASLQDLVVTAEQLNFQKPRSEKSAVNLGVDEPREARRSRREVEPESSAQPQFSQKSFQSETRQIRKLIEQYTREPNYYGPPWQLRRTFEKVHAQRVEEWFLNFGGRGALNSMDSRLQNILVASAVISILRHLYGHRIRALILANTPEQLGDWRRGLQDCLGVGRGDFGPERGIVLFESSESLAQKAERLVSEDCLPLILMDETEGGVSLSLLRFPFWLVFAQENQPRRDRSGFDWFE